MYFITRIIFKPHLTNLTLPTKTLHFLQTCCDQNRIYLYGLYCERIHGIKAYIDLGLYKHKKKNILNLLRDQKKATTTNTVR